MLQKNKCNINPSSKVLIFAFVFLSVYVLLCSYLYKNDGALLQKRLRKAYEGLSPRDYE